MANRTARHWCFTIAHPGEGADFVAVWPKQFNDTVRYVVMQCEICPKTQRDHIQGYIEMHAPTTMKVIKTFTGERSHVEPRKGTRHQARSYCMKIESRAPDTDPWEYGIWNEHGQGHRSDLDAFIDAAKQQGMKKAVDQLPAVYVKYHAGMEKMYDYHLCDSVRRIEKARGRFTKGMYPLCMTGQGDDTVDTMTQGYRGQKVLYVPSSSMLRHWMLQAHPLWLPKARRWAEWTIVCVGLQDAMPPTDEDPFGENIPVDY